MENIGRKIRKRQFMLRGIALFIALPLLLLIPCESVRAAKKKSFPAAAADTSIRLLRECMKGKEKQNALISPDSILTAVTMVESGASGKTLAEMKKTLGGLPVNSYVKALAGLNERITGQSALTYRIANSIWYREDRIALKPSYLQSLRSLYRAQAYAVPFDAATVRAINDWVSEQTGGLIPKIVDRLDPSLRTAVINTVYFKGDWQEKYQSTAVRTFRKANGQKQKVSMMEGTEHVYLTLAGGKGFVKNYRGGKLAFMALLPPKGMSVSRYLKKISGADLIRAYKKRRKSGVSVRTRMPEFKYEYSVSLKKPLVKMGIRQAFGPAADFSKMTDAKIFIDEILHKTCIDVNKDGTEAAAATAVLMKAGAVFTKTEVKKVYLTRPFVYAIIDTKTGIPLFLGAVNEVSK